MDHTVTNLLSIKEEINLKNQNKVKIIAVSKTFSEEKIPIKGMSHITGGGLIENLPRCIPNNLAAEIDLTSWKIPELFGRIQKIGRIPEIDMWNTFNQGIGFCVIVESEYAMKILDLTHGHGFKSWVIGDIILETSDKKRIYGLPC